VSALFLELTESIIEPRFRKECIPEGVTRRARFLQRTTKNGYWRTRDAEALHRLLHVVARARIGRLKKAEKEAFRRRYFYDGQTCRSGTAVARGTPTAAAAAARRSFRPFRIISSVSRVSRVRNSK